MDIKNILSGLSFSAYETLGVHPEKDGNGFSVFAPEAKSVSLIGEFSEWKDIPIKKDDNGVWSVSVKNSEAGQMYKFRITTKDGETFDRMDPFAFFSEKRPGNASVIYNPSEYKWNDSEWISSRKKEKRVLPRKSSMAHLNKAMAIVVFARDTEITTQISCRRPDIPIIAVCDEAVVANQLCLLRGVFPVVDTYLFGQRDASTTVRQFGIGIGKIVVVDDDKISLTTID